MKPKNKTKVGCFITVRTGSTRLPQKAVLLIRRRSTIEHLIDRTKLVEGADIIVLCTSTKPEDDILEEMAKRNKIKCFRGSENDKLARWLGATDKYKVDFFVTVDGDDLFCDPELIDLAITQMKENPCDFQEIPDTVEPFLICGGSARCISTRALRKVCKIKNTDDTEMMWVYFTRTGLFKTRYLKVDNPIFYNKNIRATLDYKEDLDFFARVMDEFNTDVNNIPLRSIIQLINKKPEIARINFFRQQEFLDNQKKKIKLILKK